MRNGGRRERLGGNLDLQKAGKFEPAGELNLNDPLAARIAKQIRTKTPTIVFVPSGGGRRLMARPKIHYFPFVAREYLSDLAIRPLNLEERGLFIEYLCWMWESPVRGALFKAVPVSPEFRRGFAPVSPEFRLHNIVVPLLASKTSPEADFERAKQMEQKLIETSLIRVGLGGVLYNRRLLFYTTEYELKLLSQNKFPEFKERILSVVNDFTDVSPEFRRYFAEVSPPKRPISINKAKENLKLKQRGGDKAPPPPGFNLLVGEIQKAWKSKYEANLNWNGKDGATLKALVSRNEEVLILEGWQLYLAEPDDYCRQNGQSFLNFASMFDKVVSRLAQKKKDQKWMEEK